MSKKNIKVSVILPVYNVELYLRESLDSILNQTLQDIEIICVDDGSTDSSLSILNKFAQKDKRIKILTQENQGAGVARNTGLAVAKGEYLSFLDPDDFFETKLLETSYEKAKETSADIVVYQTNTFDNRTKKYNKKTNGMINGIRSENLPQKEVFSPTDIGENIFQTFGYVPWNKFFKASFIRDNNIKFQPVFRSNDFYFTNLAIIKAEKITVLEKVLAYYRIGMKTNSQATTELYPLNFYETYKQFYDKIVEIKVNNEVIKSFYKTVFRSINYAMQQKKTYQSFALLFNHLKENFDKDFNTTINENLLTFDECYENYQLVKNNSVDDYLKIKEKYFIDESDTSLKISVIIPIYNSEKYLNDCLGSVVNQTLTNIEIICINDGSTDGSGDILREYASKDNRFITLNQSNKGQSVARNVGIINAKGKYIYFLDSDDMIVPDALETMFFECVTNNLDVVYFDGKSIFESATLEEKHSRYKTSYQSKFSTNSVLSGAIMFAKMRENNSYRVQSCLYLIKTDFVQKENILFPEGIIHQDNVFMFKTILIASRVKLIKEELFIRRVRANSTVTREITFEHFYGYIVCFIEMLDYVNKFKFTEEVAFSVNTTLNSIMDGALKEYNMLTPIEKSKISTLNNIEKFYFDTFINSKFDITTSTTNTTIQPSNSEFNKLNGQLKWARDELEKVRAERLEYKKKYSKLNSIQSSLSYKLGRLITWLPRKIRGK